MLKAGLRSFVRRLRKGILKSDSGASQPSLNDRLAAFIDRNSHRALPVREKTFQPEILIPCFNHGRYLPFLLDVLEGGHVPITIIDDHSDEPNRALIEECRSQYGAKVIRNDTNLRQAGSLNKAISASENNLFIVVNADDYLLPGWVRYAVTQFQEHELFLLGGMHICFRNHFPQSERHLTHLLKTAPYAPSSRLRRYGPDDARSFTHDNSIDMTMTGCTFLRSAWEFVGGFYNLADRVSIWDDRDFQMRVCAFFPVGVSDDLSALWRSDSSTGMGTK